MWALDTMVLLGAVVRIAWWGGFASDMTWAREYSTLVLNG